MGRAKSLLSRNPHETVMEGRQQSRMAETAGQSVTDFGEALARAALATIGEARQTLGNRDLAVPEAVHALRKALKRWRALLRLLEGPLGRQADRMRTEARRRRRSRPPPSRPCADV